MPAFALCLFSLFAFRSEFGLGADYSSQQYSALRFDTLELNSTEEDTLDIETEARAFWNGGLSLGNSGDTASSPTGLAADNALSLSTRSLRNRLSLRLDCRLLQALSLAILNDAEARVHHKALPQLADTSFSTNYLDNSSQLDLSWRPTNTTRLSISDRFQYYHYPQPDSFYRSYAANNLSAEIRQELGLLASAHVGYDWDRRLGTADDNLRHTGHRTEAGLDCYFETGTDAGIAVELGRRRYAARERSYREARASLTLNQSLFDRLRLTLGDDVNWTGHDSTTDVYQNLLENTLRLGCDLDLGASFTIRLGPQYATGRSLPVPTDQDYREVSLAGGLELFVVNRLWVSLEDRIGRRRYPLADSSYQSNYSFNELNLNVNWTVLSRPGSRLNANVMASISPEWHAVETDNFITRIFTFELKYGL